MGLRYFHYLYLFTQIKLLNQMFYTMQYPGVLRKRSDFVKVLFIFTFFSMIVKKTKKEKIKYLIELLGNDIILELCDSSKDPLSDVRKESLFTDILLGCLNFMSREGLVEWQMKVFLKVYNDLVLESACKGI